MATGLGSASTASLTVLPERCGWSLQPTAHGGRYRLARISAPPWRADLLGPLRNSTVLHSDADPLQRGRRRSAWKLRQGEAVVLRRHSKITRSVAESCGAGLASSLALVSGKSERRAARSVVADYHQAQLGELVARVGEAVDRYRAGELDAFDVDQVLFQYSRAAKELWKFCNSLEVEVAAAMIRDQPPRDWWERGAPRRRL